ncbi:MAG: KH domain-containing protein [Erysipelotrichaceae bacterium]|nr:KH domain-containing protein [Erysipelotrichaceae bacterium]MDY5252689.1 KH domain-containing protein [Erysipelotrichaceae bacterium]
MVELEKVLKNICLPMCTSPEALDVRVMPSLNENEILLYVYAKNEDVAKLIGKQGVMANSLRQMMSVASLADHKRIVIKFETI